MLRKFWNWIDSLMYWTGTEPWPIHKKKERRIEFKRYNLFDLDFPDKD